MNRLPTQRQPHILRIEDLRAPAGSPGDVDEVIVGLPDLQGRLQGSAVSVEYFTEEVVTAGLGAATYLLAADVEMDTGPGYAYAPWDSGFGDFRLVPDLETLRRTPWKPRSATVLCDPRWSDGSAVRLAPRAVLRAQLDQLAARGLTALAGTEPEFLVFAESYQQAAARSYGDLTPASRYNIDYSLIGTSDLDGLVDAIRQATARAGMRLESARAEVHPGQYEIVFRYDDAMNTCDRHVLYKTTVKNLAAQAGRAVTFMAKYDQGEGNSCHVHLSLRSRDSTPVFAAETGHGERADTAGMSALMQSFVAGQLACMGEFTVLFAPTVNSYKRLTAGSFAPSNVAWGRDNRTCPVRVVGAGPGLRIEHRVPGGDANPYLAVAGIVAAGRYGIDNGLPLSPATDGNAFSTPGLPRLPRTLREAVDAWSSSRIARTAFGDDVVDHLAQAAEIELAAYETTVTDWERRRAFERL